MIDNLLIGINVVFSPYGLLACISGCIIGTIVGIIPGLGTVAALSILLPFLYGLDPTVSIIMLSGIYYGAQYGCSNSSIVLNTPGEPSSIITCIDGYAMTKKDQTGRAIMTAGIGSLIAGILTVLLIAFFSPLLASLSYKFGPVELSLLLLLGLLSIGLLTNKNPIHGLSMGLLGILLSTVGEDSISGEIRFANNINLFDGFSIISLSIGLFGIAEVFNNLFLNRKKVKINNFKISFSIEDLKKIIPTSLRGSVVGSILGLIPGGGSVLSSFVAYAIEKKVNKKSKLGTGVVEGVAAPESANNAGAQSSFIPLLSLGIPENPVTAIFLVFLISSGIQPGPEVIQLYPTLFWGLIVSMLLGNVVLAIMNIPMIKVWLRVLLIPKYILYPIVLFACMVGVYYERSSFFDVGTSLIFGIIGLFFIKLKLETAPLIFGFVIGDMFEEQLRRSLIMSDGNIGVFIESPVFLVFGLAFLFLLIKLIKQKLLTNW